jgi:hypothetical protein
MTAISVSNGSMAGDRGLAEARCGGFDVDARDRRATPLELGPHVVAREQLVSAWAESRLVDPRCLAAGGRPTGFAPGSPCTSGTAALAIHRATWSADGFAVARQPRGSRHLASGARHVGHHS